MYRYRYTDIYIYRYTDIYIYIHRYHVYMHMVYNYIDLYGRWKQMDASCPDMSSSGLIKWIAIHLRASKGTCNWKLSRGRFIYNKSLWFHFFKFFHVSDVSLLEMDGIAWWINKSSMNMGVSISDSPYIVPWVCQRCQSLPCRHVGAQDPEWRPMRLLQTGDVYGMSAASSDWTPFLPERSERNCADCRPVQHIQQGPREPQFLHLWQQNVNHSVAICLLF